jgi:alkanesulfonate monooxygenase SsuD/methylene tetrahydromethanopterin reductase-like flavin-dependent oxidoreductase (luciferase family)
VAHGGTLPQRLSIQIPATASFPSAVRYAGLAEELGFESINCSHIAARDSFTLLSALAMTTGRVRLGTAVAPIHHRSPASMAQTAATVDDLSGGRFRLGLGTGHRSTMSDWHGQQIGNPVREMREYVALVRAILAGRTPARGERWNSTFSFVGFNPRPDVPILLAGLSPSMLRLAGEIADGVLLWACPSDYVRDVVVPEVTRGRQRAGRSLEGFEIMPGIPSAVGGDRAAVLDGVRSELHRYFGLPFYRAMFERAGFGREVAAYDAVSDREEQKRAISEEFIEQLCALGDDAAVQAGIARYRRAGATNPVITPVWGTEFEPTLRAAARMGVEVAER